MEKKDQLFMQFLEVAECLKRGKNRSEHNHKGDHKGHHNSHGKCSEAYQNEYHSCHGDKKHCIKHHDAHHEKRKHKMSPTTRNVLLLLLRENESNQRSIALSLDVTAQGVSDIIKKLEYHEMINKEQGKFNNEKLITLTDKGKEVAVEIEKNMREIADNIFREFSEEELVIFDSLLGKIQAEITDRRFE